MHKTLKTASRKHFLNVKYSEKAKKAKKTFFKPKNSHDCLKKSFALLPNQNKFLIVNPKGYSDVKS